MTNTNYLCAHCAGVIKLMDRIRITPGGLAHFACPLMEPFAEHHKILRELEGWSEDDAVFARSIGVRL